MIKRIILAVVIIGLLSCVTIGAFNDVMTAHGSTDSLRRPLHLNEVIVAFSEFNFTEQFSDLLGRLSAIWSTDGEYGLSGFLDKIGIVIPISFMDKAIEYLADCLTSLAMVYDAITIVIQYIISLLVALVSLFYKLIFGVPAQISTASIFLM